jgi:streptogramin lyase
MGSFNPESEEFKEYNTTSASSGPYAIGVDIYENIWFSMTYAYKVGKFDHGMGTLHKYDLPTPRTLARFIYDDGDGNIWFPNNSNNKIAVIVQ